MRLKSKVLGIGTGGPYIVVLSPEVVKELDLGPSDRVRVMAEKKYVVALTNVSSKIKNNEIGVFDEVKNTLNLDPRQPVTVIPEEKPSSILTIKKKLNGKKISEDEIYEIVTDIVDNRLTKSELACFVSAVYTKEMDLEETEYLTRAMAETGQILGLGVKPVIDKHCIGGVPGNRTSIIVIPIITAAGLYIPKTSSRSITDPAGTADTMEVLAPVTHSLEKIKSIVLKTKGCIVWGGALDIAPADDAIIEVEHPLGLDPSSILLASILAKKYAVGATHVLIDIPFGPGTKCDKARANMLEPRFIKLGKRLGMKVKVIKTNGSQPIGRGMGPALEARDVLWTLMRDKRAPADLKAKVLYMAGIILEMGGKAKKGQGQKLAKSILESGKALKKLKDIIKVQGGNPNIKPKNLRIGKNSETVYAPKSGRIKAIDNNLIKRISRLLGAPYNKGSGMYLHAKVGDKVKAKQPLFELYAESPRKLSAGLAFVQSNLPYKIR